MSDYPASRLTEAVATRECDPGWRPRISLKDEDTIQDRELRDKLAVGDRALPLQALLPAEW